MLNRSKSADVLGKMKREDHLLANGEDYAFNSLLPVL
jgi:hypothetical protein